MKLKKIKRKRKILCPDCKTGQESCLIDPNSPVCPYFCCYTGVRCAYYVPIKERMNKNIFYKLVGCAKKLFKINR